MWFIVAAASDQLSNKIHFKQFQNKEDKVLWTSSKVMVLKACLLLTSLCLKKNM